MGLTRRELMGYAVAGTTGMGVTAAARQYQPDDPDTAGIRQTWELGGVQARPATISESAVTFRAAVWSQFETDYDAKVVLYYGPEDGDADDWRQLAEKEGPLSEGLYLEAEATDLEPGTTYQYQAEAYLTNYADGPSRRVSEVRHVTAGQPCSGPSTNCLRAETLPAETEGGRVTLRGRARGVDAYDEVTGRFFYRREGESERWTEFTPVEGDDPAEFSATLSDLSEGSYTYYAEARGEGGDLKNMYAEGEERTVAVGEDAEATQTPEDDAEATQTPEDDAEATQTPEDETTESSASDPTESLPNHLVVFGGGGGTEIAYEVSVSGRIEADDSAGEAPIADRYVSTDADDTISGSTARGTVAGGGDAYRFSGEVTDFTADGSVRVYVNGERRR